MKLYVKLISLTIALAFVFVVGYLSYVFIDVESEWWLSLPKTPLLPPNAVFQWIWVGIYVLFAVMITLTLADRRLRSALPFWLMLGVLNVLWCAAYFTWQLPYFALAIILLEVVILAVLTNFYIKSTRIAWVLMIPILAWYCYASILNFLIN